MYFTGKTHREDRRMTSSKRGKAVGGFTLIELLVVIAIIAILADNGTVRASADDIALVVCN